MKNMGIRRDSSELYQIKKVNILVFELFPLVVYETIFLSGDI